MRQTLWIHSLQRTITKVLIPMYVMTDYATDSVDLQSSQNNYKSIDSYVCDFNPVDLQTL